MELFGLGAGGVLYDAKANYSTGASRWGNFLSFYVLGSRVEQCDRTTFVLGTCLPATLRPAQGGSMTPMVVRIDMEMLSVQGHPCLGELSKLEVAEQVKLPKAHVTNCPFISSCFNESIARCVSHTELSSKSLTAPFLNSLPQQRLGTWDQDASSQQRRWC